MNINSLVYGTISIITTVIVLAALGSTYSILNKTAEDLVPKIATTELQPLVNTFCTKESDCKQNPKDCNQCVNILTGGISILNRCDDNKIPCACLDNKCAITNN
ncbi:MAG TPA: hypothetical protein VI790_02760 [Candidatus Nanoarchaeia archaeon]|nr:hypothetical protein [Candidatus Nanoarchaeia archaeon]